MKKIRNQDQNNDLVWQKLFNQQFFNLQNKKAISKIWINGLCKLGLDNSKVPLVAELSAASQKYTGWIFTETDEEFTDSLIWNKGIIERKMPVTSFVRTFEELYYCNQPDKWHDIIGHIPVLMDEEYSLLYQEMARLYVEIYKTDDEVLKRQISNLNWFVAEIGLIRENSQLKALGATLYSSSGELEKAFSKKPLPFSLEALTTLQPFDRSRLQDQYFVIESLDQLSEAIETFRKTFEEKLKERKV